MTYDYRVENAWDNGEFMTGATVVFLMDDEEMGRETLTASREFPGETAVEMAISSGVNWCEVMTYSLEERLGAYGREWEREQEERTQQGGSA